MPEQEKCLFCHFYQGGTQNAGLCRKNPPILQWIPLPVQTMTGAQIQMTPCGGFPQTKEGDWCGAFELGEQHNVLQS